MHNVLLWNIGCLYRINPLDVEEPSYWSDKQTLIHNFPGAKTNPLSIGSKLDV